MFIYVLPEGSCKKVIIFIFLPFRNKIYFSTYIDIWTYHVKVCWSVLVCYNNICQKIGVYFSPKIGGRKILKICFRSFYGEFVIFLNRFRWPLSSYCSFLHMSIVHAQNTRMFFYIVLKLERSQMDDFSIYTNIFDYFCLKKN